MIGAMGRAPAASNGPQAGKRAGAVHGGRFIQIVRDRLQDAGGHGENKRKAQPGLHHDQRRFSPERVGQQAFGVMPKKDKMALLITPNESLNMPAKNQNRHEARHRPRQNENCADHRLKAQIFLVDQNRQQHADGTLRSSPAASTHRPLQYVKEGRAPDG